MNYDHSSIEKKWQKIWEKKGWKAKGKGKKFYPLVEFPFPSGDGLHIGHPRPYIGMDVIARKRRAEGYDVLYPMGWDAFGLPTENYAIKTGQHPAIVTKNNTDNFRKQIKSLGLSFDWSREINTTDPNYYKWTQWIFLQFFKKGLAYKTQMPINWCLSCKIGLANEEVIDGRCERCGGETVKKDKEQWMLAITKYAERLDKDLDTVDYLPQVVAQQRNWIGKSEGAEIPFKIYPSNFKNHKEKELTTLTVFTTRPDTIFGVTYMVISPEHPLLKEFKHSIKNIIEVGSYIATVSKKPEMERIAENKEKTGVKIEGLLAINSANKEELPIYVADYVLMGYGTGAIMAVPAHDERDHAFAKKFNLPIKEVISPNRVDKNNPPVKGKRYVERNNVQVIVRNPKDNKFLLLKWKKQPWITFPMGGVEKGEDVIQAAKREVLEETGYKNLTYIKTLGGEVRAEYFAAHKDENRIAHTQAIMFDLTNEEKEERLQEESDAYDLMWYSKNEIVYPKVVHAELHDWLERWDNDNYLYTGPGVLINSEKCSGLTSEEAKKEIIKITDGKSKISFKLRDWVFSRQRYWGEPIPIINCPSCGFVPVPEKELPLKLPETENYKPRDDGESPLASIESWVNVKCPQCGGPAKRETDVMPNWAGSSWYYLRYTDPHNKKEFASAKNLKYFIPVDWYNGGMEHTTLHLLYSRFWHKFLYDLKLVPGSEPYKKRTSHGLILASDGTKMSKSKGNVINPDSIVERVGADSLRLYEMFMGPFDQAIQWNDDALVGCRRFLERVWKLQEKVGNKKSNAVIETIVHKTIKKVSEDIEGMKFNTAVSTLMQLLNGMEGEENISKKDYESLLTLLAPFAPHITEEIWSNLKNKGSIHEKKWPIFDKKKIVDALINVAVSVNGKMRGIIEISPSEREEVAVEKAKQLSEVSKWLSEGTIRKVIYIPGKIINFVIS